MTEESKKKKIQKPLKVECFYTPPVGSKCGKIFEVKYNLARGVNILSEITEVNEPKRREIKKSIFAMIA